MQLADDVDDAAELARLRVELDAKQPSAYDLVSSFSDPRRRGFAFGDDTVSEDEVERAEKENYAESSDEDYVPSDDDGGESVASDGGE
jgi:hypothetical protein